MAPPTVPMMYSSVARSDPPALICVTTIAVMITQRPCNGTFSAWATASAAKADTVMRTQKRQSGLDARSRAAMRCKIAGRSVVIRQRWSLRPIQPRGIERICVQGKVAGLRTLVSRSQGSWHAPWPQYPLKIAGLASPVNHVLDSEIAERHRCGEGETGLISCAAFVASGDDAARIKSRDRALPLMHDLAHGIGQQSGRISNAWKQFNAVERSNLNGAKCWILVGLFFS